MLLPSSIYHYFHDMPIEADEVSYAWIGDNICNNYTLVSW